MKKNILLLALVLLFSQEILAQANIAAARLLPLGSVVTIKGIVTNGSELGTPLRYIQDNTGGIAGYSSTYLGSMLRGDSISVTGTLKDYNELLELDPVTASTKYTSGNALPAPQLITPLQMGEDYEGELVKIENVTFVSTGSFAGNVNYTFMANGETGQIRINNSSNLVGTLIPTGEVHLVGILSQFYQTFQLLVRDKADIIWLSNINMSSDLLVSGIDTSSFDLAWTTDSSGTTEILYGRTTSYELGALTDVAGTAHAISITGLNAGDLVYVKAFSVRGNDTASFPMKVFATQSNSSGVIKTYFTRSVDTSYSTGTDAIYLNQTLEDTIINYINRAKYSIDMAIYNFNTSGLSNFASALNAAHTRGVQVRVVYDGSTANMSIPSLNAGIGKIQSPDSDDPYGIMHNKFFIIDALSTNPNDPLVLTGSTNLTESQINMDANNLIIIQDQSLAKSYKLEFEEMFGDVDNTPNAANAKFGPFKKNNTAHQFIIGGKKVESYFSPSDATNQKIINTINTANTSICVATMLITRSDIAYALRDKNLAGVSTKVIVDSKAACMPNGSTTVTTALAGLGANFKQYGEGGILHHKYLIVDHSNTASDPTVITGCHNWSTSAETKNDENTLIIHDSTLSNVFYQEFVNRFSQGIGINDTVKKDVGISKIMLSKTNPKTGDSVYITVRIKNYSTTNIMTVIPLWANFNGFNNAEETWFGILNPLDSVDFTFPNYFVPTTLASQTAYSRTTYDGDFNPGNDGLILFFDCDNGLNDLQNNDMSVMVYPNPSKPGQIQLLMHNPKSGKTNISISDLSGKKTIILQENLMNGSQIININTSNLCPGIYFMDVVSAGFRATRKVVIQ